MHENKNGERPEKNPWLTMDAVEELNSQLSAMANGIDKFDPEKMITFTQHMAAIMERENLDLFRS